MLSKSIIPNGTVADDLFHTIIGFANLKIKPWWERAEKVTNRFGRFFRLLKKLDSHIAGYMLCVSKYVGYESVVEEYGD